MDLDAATGRGSNRSLVRTILDEADVPVQVGGGVRSGDVVEELLDAGATGVVVGTRALEEIEWRSRTDTDALVDPPAAGCTRSHSTFWTR